MIDSPLFKEIDWMLIILLLLNSAIGIIVIYSASHYLPGNMYLKQLVWILISIAAFALVLAVDYKILVAYSHYFYFFCITVLIGLELFGRIMSGTTSWVRVSFIRFQPSEITKIAVILVLTRIFFEFKEKYLTFDRILLAGGVVGLPVLLIALQPDLGTSLTFIPILLSAFFLGGINRRVFAIILISALLLGIGMWSFFLKDYQKERLITLFSPGHDPLGAGYHIAQSKIAIGSGGLLGKGYRKGTQSQLRFLPARHTDFIFSVIGEEFGFLGIITVIFVYFLFLQRLFNSVKKSRDKAGVYVIFLVSTLIAFQFFVNVMVVVGLFPVTGIPLPLISYGGSSLLTHFMAVGLVLNVTTRRFVNV